MYNINNFHSEPSGAEIKGAAMSEKKKILGCPFCGSDEVALYAEDVPVFNGDDATKMVFARMVCGQCAAEGPLVTIEVDSEDETIEQAAKNLWNTRSDEDISTRSAIKPCPFCGELPDFIEEPASDDSDEKLIIEIFCPKCSATGPVLDDTTADVLWNSRK